MRRLFTPFRLAFLCTALDSIWAVQAMGSVPRHVGSNVAMVSLAVWVVLHLPAALLASLALDAAGALKGPVSSLPLWSLAVMGALGLAQTFALVYCLSARALRRSAR
jgi:hypothetical protein